MKTLHHLIFWLLALSSAAQDSYSKILQEELTREFEILSKEDPPVYYMDYRYQLKNSWRANASFGKIVSAINVKNGDAFVQLRVGSPEFDNFHEVSQRSMRPFVLPEAVTYNPSAESLAQTFWQKTMEQYAFTGSQYLQKKNLIQQEEQESIADFSPADAQVYYEDPIPAMSPADFEKVQTLIANASKAFKGVPHLKFGNVAFNYNLDRKYFFSSDEQSIVQNYRFARIIVTCALRTEEGDEVYQSKIFDGFSPKALPEQAELDEAVQSLIDKVQQLREAPKAEPYAGPAVLSADAAGVFFHEILGHRIEGHRLRQKINAQTFKKKLGEQVLPKTLSVIFDPEMSIYEGQDLNGYYQYDDQGVKGKKVSIIENGILQSFLMSRTPVPGIDQSNGHGRGDIRNHPVSRQSVMQISTSKPMEEDKLISMLKKECKKQKLEYGYYIANVTGGYTTTHRYSPNAFNVAPTEVYKVFVDDRPNQLVRGVNLIGTPLAMFSTIEAAGDRSAVFNGFCGAESGSVPVSAIAPMILATKIETQKKVEKSSTGPLLPDPMLVSNPNN
ncbi:MAG: TldD/PmbA family protein [Bacteroidota bacterium]